MSFARRVFFWAAIYGFLVLFPQYFLLERNGRDFPPAITHPEYYYGFVGLALVWQAVFLLISRDPARYRPLMPLAVLEKAVFGIPAAVLYLQHDLPLAMLGAGLVDLTLGTLFLAAWLKTAEA
jgi:hypothetical protein